MGWSRSLAHSFSPALRAQCPETGGAWTQAPSAGGRRRSPGEQRGQCPPSSWPSLSPLGGLGGSPGGTGRATCPRPLCPAAMTDSAASFRGPVAEPSPPAVPSSPSKGSPPGLCHGILSQEPLPYLPYLDLRLGKRVGTLVAPAASVPSRGKFILGVGGGHSSIQSPGWDPGGGDASADQFVVFGVLRLVLCVSICPQPRGVSRIPVSL